MTDRLLSSPTVRGYDVKFKIIICGDSTVGKTSLVKMYSVGHMENIVSTIGVDYVSTGIQIKDEGKKVHIQLQIWDTAGQERFRSIITNFYKTAYGAIIMFDVTNRESFKSLDYWVDQIRSYAKKDIPILIVGNKCKEVRRAMLDLEIEAWLEKNPISYLEIDNVNQYQIDDTFTKMAELIYEVWKQENDDLSVPEWGITNLLVERTVYSKGKDWSSCCSIS